MKKSWVCFGVVWILLQSLLKRHGFEGQTMVNGPTSPSSFDTSISELSFTNPGFFEGRELAMVLNFAIVIPVPLKSTKDPTWTLGTPRRTSAALSSLASQVGKLLREMVPFWVANKFNLSTWLWGMDIRTTKPQCNWKGCNKGCQCNPNFWYRVKSKHDPKRSTCDKYFNSSQHFDEICPHKAEHENMSICNAGPDFRLPTCWTTLKQRHKAFWNARNRNKPLAEHGI